MENECPYLYKQVINNNHDSCDQLAKESLKAYATLLSAAPELYEALNNLVELATKQLDQSATNEGMENCDCLASARAALAKAEGR